MDPFWAGVIGGAVGGVVVAFIESFLSRSREHQRWLREERQRKYVDLVDRVSEVYSAQDRVLKRYRGYAPKAPPNAVYVSMVDELDGLRRQVEDSLLRLRLVASPRIMDKADSLGGRASEVWETLSFASEPPSIERLWQFQLYWEEIDDFIGAARRELGSGRDFVTPVRMWYRRRLWGLRGRLGRTRPEPEAAAETVAKETPAEVTSPEEPSSTT